MSEDDNLSLEYDSFLEYSAKHINGIMQDDVYKINSIKYCNNIEEDMEKKNHLLESIIYRLSDDLHIDKDKITSYMTYLDEKSVDEIVNIFKLTINQQVSQISIKEMNKQGELNHKDENNNGIEEDLETLEFIPPIEGTPAAEALAANKMIEVSKVTKAYHRIRAMKRPKMKNFNIVKKLNKVTKQKRVKKHFSKNFKGKVIDGLHELYTLTAGIMLGVRCTVRHIASHPSSPAGVSGDSGGLITAADFEQIEKVAFPPKGNPDEMHPYPTPAHDLAHTFQFKSYAPKVFHRIREFFDISASAYMASVCGDYNFIEFISNSKSGQFFFYSHDGQYMLKTQTKEENKFMIRILPRYYQYLKENPNSLLVRFLGMHRIEMYHLRRKVHFVIMTSVFDTPNLINKIYDLKGSLIGREASQQDRENGGVLKDNDLLRDNCKIHLGAKKALFMKQLEKDAMFLAQLNIMDYSLLVGIHDRDKRTTVQSSMTPNLTDVAPDSLLQPIAKTTSLSDKDTHVSIHPATRQSITTGSGTHAIRQSISGESNLLIKQRSNTPFRRRSTDTTTTTHTVNQTLIDSNKLEYDITANNMDSYQKTESIQSDINDIIVNIDNSTGKSMNKNINQNIIADNSSPMSIAPSNDENDITETEDEADEDVEVEEDPVSSEGSSIFEDIDAGDSDVEDYSNKSHEKALIHNTTPIRVGTWTEALISPPNSPAAATSSMIGSGMNATSTTVAGTAVSPTSITSTTSMHPMSDRSGNRHAQAPSPLHVNARIHPWTTRKDEGINSRNRDGTKGNEIYYLGVIDILQQYNTNKRAETIVKGVTNDRKQISSVAPIKYAKRFIKFMDNNID